MFYNLKLLLPTTQPMASAVHVQEQPGFWRSNS